MDKNSGLLISVEGIDGSGKSTLVLALAELLEGSGKEIIVTREPGKTQLGKKIRYTLACDKAA